MTRAEFIEKELRSLAWLGRDVASHELKWVLEHAPREEPRGEVCRCGHRHLEMRDGLPRCFMPGCPGPAPRPSTESKGEP